LALKLSFSLVTGYIAFRAIIVFIEYIAWYIYPVYRFQDRRHIKPRLIYLTNSLLYFFLAYYIFLYSPVSKPIFLELKDFYIYKHCLSSKILLLKLYLTFLCHSCFFYSRIFNDQIITLMNLTIFLTFTALELIIKF